VGFTNNSHMVIHTVTSVNKEFGSFNQLQIKLFAPTASQLRKFNDHITGKWHTLSGRPEYSESAGDQLEEVTHVTLAAAPDNRFKDHWSPPFSTLRVHPLPMLSLQRHHGVLSPPRRQRSWVL